MLTPEQKKRVSEIRDSIDLMDSQAAVQYGAGAQRNISGFADNILTQIRSKDSGYVGDMMSELMLKVKDVGVDKLGEKSLLDRIPGFKDVSRSLKKFMQRYETLEVQIDRIEGELDKARMELLKDIGMFDSLYEKNLEYFRELQVYIVAGEEKIQEIRTETLPSLREQAREKGDPMSAQLVTDFEDTVNRFEKKVHDLKLSKTIAIQTAPQIRLIQNNDKLLVEKISDSGSEYHSSLEEPDCDCAGLKPPAERAENAERGIGYHQCSFEEKRRASEAEYHRCGERVGTGDCGHRDSEKGKCGSD